MRRVFSLGMVWLILEVVSLRAAVALSPVASCPSSSSASIHAHTSSEQPRNGPLLEELPSTSQELSWLCEQESKHVNVRVHFADLCLLARQRDARLQSVSTRDFFPLFCPFPRKFLPSSTDDDPFLS
jgi:hypothetical protein